MQRTGGKKRRSKGGNKRSSKEGNEGRKAKDFEEI
jgi:hypothetical protein